MSTESVLYYSELISFLLREVLRDLSCVAVVEHSGSSRREALI